MMKMPISIITRADSIYGNWRQRRKVSRYRFRSIVHLAASWHETYTGMKPTDGWFDSAVEDVDLLLSGDEILEQILDRADLPSPPEHYRPGMTLEEVEAPELVRRLAGTATISRESSKMQIAAVKAWITMWLRKGEADKAEFATSILQEYGLLNRKKPPASINEARRAMAIPIAQA